MGLNTVNLISNNQSCFNRTKGKSPYCVKLTQLCVTPAVTKDEQTRPLAPILYNVNGSPVALESQCYCICYFVFMFLRGGYSSGLMLKGKGSGCTAEN